MAATDIVAAFAEAVANGDLDTALTYLADDASLESTLGTQSGKAAIRGTLTMIQGMGGLSPLGAPTAQGDDVVLSVKSPIGPMRMTFSLEHDQIYAIVAA